MALIYTIQTFGTPIGAKTQTFVDTSTETAASYPNVVQGTFSGPLLTTLDLNGLLAGTLGASEAGWLLICPLANGTPGKQFTIRGVTVTVGGCFTVSGNSALLNTPAIITVTTPGIAFNYYGFKA